MRAADLHARNVGQYVAKRPCGICGVDLTLSQIASEQSLDRLIRDIPISNAYLAGMINFYSVKRAPDLAIDLGTANMRIIVRGEGLVFNEPSLCCYENASGRMKLVAAGSEVLAMVDRVSGSNVVRSPLARGVLQDMEATSALLAHGLSSVVGKRRKRRPTAMIGIPSDATKAEANALLSAADDAGLGRIELVREPFAAAIGAGMPVREARASMIVECGAGTTEVAVFSIDGQCHFRSVRMGGLSLDDAISEHLHMRA